MKPSEQGERNAWPRKKRKIKIRDSAKGARNDDDDGERKKEKRKLCVQWRNINMQSVKYSGSKAQRQSKGNTFSSKRSASLSSLPLFSSRHPSLSSVPHHVHISATHKNAIISHRKHVSVAFVSRALPMAHPPVSPRLFSSRLKGRKKEAREKKISDGHDNQRLSSQHHR